ncbi:MAG: hypothetical protein LBT36_03415, partial [Oscillospiraceae bacterium]|nr:hypothetical protein [Oscillospiraceae bacterium]
YTFVEKSLPRYLSLAKDARVILVGPATPIAPVLYEFGASGLAGFIVKDAAAAERIALGLGGNMHGTGQKVNLIQ